MGRDVPTGWGRVHGPVPSFQVAGSRDEEKKCGMSSKVEKIVHRRVDSLRDQITLCNAIASQFIRYNLPGCAALSSEQAFEESLCCRSITARR